MKFFHLLILPTSLLLLWVIVSSTSIVDSLFLPTPWVVVGSIVEGLVSGELARDLSAIILRSITGFSLAAIVGIPLGLVIGRSPLFSRATQPTIDFFRSIPATALSPLFLFVFGLGDTAKVAIVVYACSLIILVNTAYGALQVKTARLLSAKVMGANRWHLFWNIVVPESAPGIFAGLRITLSLSFVMVVVTEMFIGTNVGLGYRIMNSQMIYRIPEMYSGIVLAGIVGYLANLAMILAEKKLLHWVGK